MLEEIKDNSFEDYENEKQDMLNREKHSLLSTYSSYSQFIVDMSDKDEIISKTSQECVEPNKLFDNPLFTNNDDSIQLTIEQIDSYIKKIITQAVKCNSTEIYIDDINELARIRYRIDGKLELDNLDCNMNHSLLSQRLKVMAEFFIEENSIIQKGFVSYYLAPDKRLDISVILVPTVNSELIIIKMPNIKVMPNYANIGMTSEDFRTVETIFETASGLVVISGMSGSGRTTTLYSLINKIPSKEKSIITIEKNIFERIPGISQIEVGGFSDISLKDILINIKDFDVDVLVIDCEINPETVKILLNIALGGKLVIITSYFPTAFDTIVGLISMGIEPYTVAAALEGIIAQNLVRKICPSCYKSNKLGKPIMKECSVCNGAVYTTKTGVFEVFKMNRNYWPVILKKDEHDKLKTMLENERCSFDNNCKRLVRSGITSLEEILRLGIIKGNIEY
jgi:type II secretory ATPase GspE/PulE/Tfp pilus assembly ATPase PilB-like protein